MKFNVLLIDYYGRPHILFARVLIVESLLHVCKL